MKREPKAAKRFEVESDFAVTESSLTVVDKSNIPKKYSKFLELNGVHPYYEAVPEGCVLYPVRTLKEGRVTYFNFQLAKEMGLIEVSHPDKLNKDLEKTLLETFAIRIINEYDLKSRKGFKGESVKPNKFMATRYLQLQHNDKKGRTSGDGRSVWNGVVRSGNKTWDVSSRGTGVTCLAPGVVEAGKPLKTGGTSHGYGCGLAEIDELYGSAIMSEIFHRQGLPTERVLCIIDTGNNTGIGVRAHQNLVRPAHMFMFLKQSDYKSLRRVVNYFIDRQVDNKAWPMHSKGPARYDEMCEHVARAFARLTARLKIEYIFVWLDWDGDNILADGSIIDYGSVRQFGLRHDQYRYDDIDRFSTNLNEQKKKAREIVQVFLQMADYLKTGRKKSVSHFVNHKTLKKFDELYEGYRREYLLERVGFNTAEVKKIISRYKDDYSSFEEAYLFFEKTKTSKPLTKVADGVNRPAIFNMRDLLREMPNVLAEGNGYPVASEMLFDVMLSQFAHNKDAVMTKQQGERLQDLQLFYLELVDAVRGRRSRERYLRELSTRALLRNQPDRITGNAVTIIVDEILQKSKSGLSGQDIQTVIDSFVVAQTLWKTPEIKKAEVKNLFDVILQVAEEHREDI